MTFSWIKFFCTNCTILSCCTSCFYAWSMPFGFNHFLFSQNFVTYRTFFSICKTCFFTCCRITSHCLFFMTVCSNFCLRYKYSVTYRAVTSLCETCFFTCCIYCFVYYCCMSCRRNRFLCSGNFSFTVCYCTAYNFVIASCCCTASFHSVFFNRIARCMRNHVDFFCYS